MRLKIDSGEKGNNRYCNLDYTLWSWTFGYLTSSIQTPCFTAKRIQSPDFVFNFIELIPLEKRNAIR